jgi:cytoskeletal protein RodZ
LKKVMKFRTLIFFLGILLPGSFGLLLLQAQNAGQAELPSAPSASQAAKQPQKPTPAAEQPVSTPQQRTQQSQPPADPTPASVPPAEQPGSNAGQNQPPKTGTSNSPLGPGPSEDDSLATIRSIVNEVNVVFTVTDRHNHYVRDLKKENFKVVDDNKPQRKSAAFTPRPIFLWKWACWWMPATRCVTVSSSSSRRRLSS